MSNSEAIEKIKKLSDQERKVFELFCEDLFYIDIGKKLYIKETTVKKHMSNIRLKFGIDKMNKRKRDSVLRNEFCMALKTLKNQDQKKDIEEGSEIGTKPTDTDDAITDSDIIENDAPDEKVQDKEKESEKPIADVFEKIEKKTDELPSIKKQKKPVDEKKDGNQMKKTDQPKNDRFRSLKTIWRVISIVAIIFSGYMIYDRFFGTPPTQSASTAEEPGIDREEIVVVDTQSTPAEEIQPAANPTESSVPESITPPKPAVLFEDNFDAGLSEVWELVSGNPIVVNGTLSADRDTWLLVGDPTWTNYSVEFQGESGKDHFYDGADIVALRVFDMDNMYAYKWVFVERELYVVENGEWNIVPQTYFLKQRKVSNFRFEVKGDSIKVYIDGIIESSFFDDKFTQGRIGLFVSKDTVIDDFKVREILE